MVPLEGRALAPALRDAEVVIHSLHARRAVARAAAAGRRLLELRHDLSPLSAARFRDELAVSRLAAVRPARSDGQSGMNETRPDPQRGE